MTANELLRNPVSRLDYESSRASALPPDELHPGELYTARLLLGGVVRPAVTQTGIYAVDAFVELKEVFVEIDRIVEIRYVSDDGQPEGPVYKPNLTEDGFIQGTAAPVPTREGYFLSSTGPLEDELWELEKEMLVPALVLRTSAAPPIEHRLYNQ